MCDTSTTRRRRLWGGRLIINQNSKIGKMVKGRIQINAVEILLHYTIDTKQCDAGDHSIMTTYLHSTQPLPNALALQVQ